MRIVAWPMRASCHHGRARRLDPSTARWIDSRRLVASFVLVTFASDGDEVKVAAGKPCAAAVLRSARHTLLPFTEALVCERYIGWLNDPRVNRFLEVRHARQTMDSGREFVRSVRQDAQRYFWAVTEGPERELVGTATLYLNADRSSGEIGLLIGELDRWGRGTADETIDLVVQFGFAHLHLNRVTGGTYANNMSMNFTLRRLGFVRETIVRQSHHLDDGTAVDEFRWGAASAAWKPRTVMFVENATP